MRWTIVNFSEIQRQLLRGISTATAENMSAVSYKINKINGKFLGENNKYSRKNLTERSEMGVILNRNQICDLKLLCVQIFP